MTTSADTVACRGERSRHFLALADDGLARGELEEASNRVWGAAAHAIKRRPNAGAGNTTPIRCYRKPYSA